MPPTRNDYEKLLTILERSNDVLTVARALSEQRSVSMKTVVGSSRALVIASLWRLGSLPFVVVTPDDRDVDDISHDLSVLLGRDNVAVLRPLSTRSAVRGGALHHDHIDAIQRLHGTDPCVLVTTASMLYQHVPSADGLTSATMSFSKGDVRDFSELTTELSLRGFERTDYVAQPGDIAVRGGIIDIFPSGWDNPLRLEFWGDTIESIREFEPLSQRSIRELETVSVLARVFHEDDGVLESIVLDHLPDTAVLVLERPDVVSADIYAHIPEADVTRLSTGAVLRLNALGEPDVTVETQMQPGFAASIEALLKTSDGLWRRGTEIWIGADGKQNISRIRELCENLTDHLDDEEAERATAYHKLISSIRWVASALTDGFMWPSLQLAVFTEHQVFGRQRAQHRVKRREGGISLRELQQLHRGDYIVHEDKGIGRFDGLETIIIGGSAQECVKMTFDGGDHLYVHLNYVHKLSKYASEEGSVPKLSKLGSAEWERRKARAKKRIKDIARDLIQLYARRKSMPGFAYPTDTVWQKEFEASFQYEDTADQARATAEVKHDMESPSPMDRLICGDVGFGKTEVAVRAAFKAAQAGRQVAVLVPTTILAQQHFVTFSDRLSRYPVKVAVLSRFKSKAQQKETLEQLAKGNVDIIIGTHRLLSKDVVFRQLGLLIIDEEHRFGVAAKEKLRALRASVDTLTLTATPIPRTLNFSLMGARDLSVIETPPRNRLPVQTEILEWDDETVREALLRELERGGQAFVVTDRISEIERLSRNLRMLVPSLRVAEAHGQMESEQLENVMEGFLERRFDVLIATKIIESGLDIPNANTMIIHNADNFGLAELYQLRGRVGRSNTQAYCFLVIPPVYTLSRTSLRRLQALEEFTDLGSGFQLAMRDMEIRGAGNLLGGEQSGFILDMGFELYQKIVDEAVAELRTEEFSELFGTAVTGRKGHKPFENEDVSIELDRDALLPKSYIPGDTDRYDAYKRLFNAEDVTEVDTVFAELRDRFGSLPPEADELRFAVEIRIAALPLGATRVTLRDTTLRIECPPDSNTAYYEGAFPKLLPIVTSMRNARFVQQGKRLFIEVELARRDDAPFVLRDFSAALPS